MANRPQNWYRNNNTRLPTLDDYVLLGNLDPGDPGGPELTAAMMVQNTASFLDQVVTANTTAKPGQILPVKAAGGTFTVTAPDNATEGQRFGVQMMDAGQITVDGNGFNVQVPHSVTFAQSIAILDEGAVYGWTLADPDLTGLRWMISGTYNEPAAVQWSTTLVTPTESPFQAQPNRIVRHDPRTVTTETDLIIRAPNPTSHPEIFDPNHPIVTFGIKEVYGSNNRIQVETGDAGVVIENPRTIPASADTFMETGGSGEYLEWELSDNKDIWLLTVRTAREISSGYAVWRGITTNGDVPAGNIRSSFNVGRIARTATGVYEIYPQAEIPSGAVIFSYPTVQAQTLAANQFGQGYQTGVTTGAEGTAKIAYQYGYRTKVGAWTDFDFSTSPDEMAVRIFGVA